MALLRDPELGHLVGIEQAPPKAAALAEYPKWVRPHESHVVHDPQDRPIVPGFDFHVDRAGVVTVLVRDEGHEAEAVAEKKAPAEDNETDEVA